MTETINSILTQNVIDSLKTEIIYCVERMTKEDITDKYLIQDDLSYLRELSEIIFIDDICSITRNFSIDERKDYHDKHRKRSKSILKKIRKLWGYSIPHSYTYIIDRMNNTVKELMKEEFKCTPDHFKMSQIHKQSKSAKCRDIKLLYIINLIDVSFITSQTYHLGFELYCFAYRYYGMEQPGEEISELFKDTRYKFYDLERKFMNRIRKYVKDEMNKLKLDISD